MNIHFVEQLQSRIDALEQELEDLKGGMDYIPCLTPLENYIVQSLMLCSPRTMSTCTLHERVCEHFGRNPKVESLKVSVCNARRKLSRYGIKIQHVYYHGYLIDACSKRKCLALMKGEIG